MKVTCKAYSRGLEAYEEEEYEEEGRGGIGIGFSFLGCVGSLSAPLRFVDMAA